jgi:Domain of unknown function (DUF1918)
VAQVDDQVQVVSPKLGGHVRQGVVTGVSGSLLRIRWSTGEESTVVPAAGSLRVTSPAALSQTKVKGITPATAKKTRKK